MGRNHYHPIPRDEDAVVLTPDDIMANTPTAGYVAIYDDDHYYMGSAIAEALARKDTRVTLITPRRMFPHGRTIPSSRVTSNPDCMIWA